MANEHYFEFGHLLFMDTYAVITCNDGVNIDFDQISEIESVLDSTYGGQRFCLIANRVNSYSVNPLAIGKLFSRVNLLAGAIVGEDIQHAVNAAIENMMVKDATIKYFFAMDPAVEWVEGILRDGTSVH